MKALSVLSLTLVSALSFLGSSSGSSNPRYLVKLPLAELRAHAADIRAIDADVAGINVQKGTADLIVDAEQLATLAHKGVQTIRNPSRVSLDKVDPKYKTPDQIASILAGYEKNYPNLAHVQSIGKSVQGRDIFAIKLTQNVKGDNSSKPTILFNGMHHAREVMSTEVPLDIIDSLLTGYGKDAKVTHWLDANVVYVIPMLNVDGNNKVWTEDSMWRKNSRSVDINRNYPFDWASCGGSSSSTGAEDYHGPSAASEPETQDLMAFVKSIKPIFDISFHSYSEIVIYPYGCGEHTETANVIEPIGEQMAALIPSDEGRGSYTAGLAPDLLYTVDGDDISWMYHEVKVIPYVIEVNSDSQGFQPSYNEWRDKTVTKLRPAWQLLLDKMQDPAVRKFVSELRSN